LVGIVIHILLQGKIKNKQQVEQFSADCLEHFFKGRIKREVDIDIRFTKSLSDKAHGGCYGDNQYIVLEIAKGMQVDKEYFPFDYKEIIVTLAHELVHAQQHIRKKWRKQTIDNIISSETEAYSLEYMLYDKYWN
jgi:hypothetical protein|tara:strand:- start:11149 stop:11553 length:405 start_codon:yes stop_codon:yes gene_type:complete